MRAAFTALEDLSDEARPFLDLFKALGCYLDDLCLEPINHLPDSERTMKRQEAEAGLVKRLAFYAPLAVAAIGKTTAAPHVSRAMVAAGINDRPFVTLPFPGRPEHKRAFQADLQGLLRRLRQQEVLESEPPRNTPVV